MLMVAIGCFALAAVFGLYLLSLVLRNLPTRKTVVFLHGPLAVAGVCLLIAYSYYYSPAPIISLVLFLLAAVGGLFMFYRDMTGQSIPKLVALGHGIIAITAFLFLLAFVYNP